MSEVKVSNRPLYNIRTENYFNAHRQRDDEHFAHSEQFLQSRACSQLICHYVDLDQLQRDFTLDWPVLHILRGTSPHWHNMASNSAHAQRCDWNNISPQIPQIPRSP